MQVKIQKWGNSFAIRLNEDLSNHLNVEVGDVLDLEVIDGALRLKSAAPVYTMDDLLRGCTKQNMALNNEDSLWLNPPPVGTEFK